MVLDQNLLNGHALHAAQIEFTFNGQSFSFSKDVPEDFQHALRQLDLE